MGSTSVVVGGIRRERPIEMALIQDDRPVGPLRRGRSAPAVMTGNHQWAASSRRLSDPE